MKDFLYFKKLASILILLFIGLSSNLFAYDAIEETRDPLQYYKSDEYFTIQQEGEKIWHLDIDSGCNYSDHNIYMDIDVDTRDITNSKIRMTNEDVDYNDPQSCSGGPEVDYLYINGNFIGQLQ